MNGNTSDIIYKTNIKIAFLLSFSLSVKLTFPNINIDLGSRQTDQITKITPIRFIFVA
jgi:hypothetical protein